MVLLTRRGLLVVLVSTVLGVLLAGCATRSASNAEKNAAPAVTVVPVAETRVITVTREVPMTVVVTATPVPTPAYTSKVKAAAGTLVYPLASEPTSLDPQDVADEVSALVAGQIYEGLFDLDEKGATVPAAAVGLDSSPDTKTFTVTLRSGMVWSDGQPVTAQNYVDGVCRLLDPTVGSASYYLLTDIAPVLGAREYASGDSADCNKVGVKAVDDLTLRITLEQPAAFLPQLLAMPIFWPAPPAATGTVSGTLPTGTTPVGPVVNGAYLLAEWAPNRQITLVKNPRYWNADQVDVERIEFRIVPDLAEQLALYEGGDLQVADFPASATEHIQGDPAFEKELHVLVRPGVSYLGLNTQTGPTADANVRRAIASAIDRKALIEQVLKQPWHVAAQTLIPPGIPGYQGDRPDVGVPYNPDAARQALADAGYGPDKPVPPITLWYNREGNNEVLFKAVGAMLEEVGFPVRLVSSKWEIYRDALQACHPAAAKAGQAAAPPGAGKTAPDCSYNLYRMGWVMDYADPSSLLDVVFSPKSTFQFTGWQSADYEKLIEQARAESDEAGRNELYGQAERILLNDAIAVIPLQYYDRTVLVKDGIEFAYPPFGPPNFKYWKAP